MYILVAVATDGGRFCLMRAGFMIEPPPNPTVPPTKPPTNPIVKTGRILLEVYLISDKVSPLLNLALSLCSLRFSLIPYVVAYHINPQKSPKKQKSIEPQL